MDFQTANQSLMVLGKVFDKKSEYPIDCEFTLPDYCPDVERILKCSIVPRISNLAVLTDTAQVEINASICILYVTNEDKLFGYEMPISLSKTINTGNYPKETIKQYNAKTEYVNCRAVNTRKIDVHGSVSVALKLSMCQEQQFISDVTDESVVVRKKNVNALETCGFGEKQINVNDDISLASGSGSVSNIIRYSCIVVPQECKSIAGKAIVKVNICFEILYLSSDLRYETLRHSVPVNQVIDVDGITDDSICHIAADVCTSNLKPISNDEGEMRSINASAKINICVVAYNNREVSMVTDGYSTKYESNITKSNIAIHRFVKYINECFSVADSVDATSEISQIVDFRCDLISCSVRYEGGDLCACGDICVGISLIDNSGCLKYYEKVVSYKNKLKPETAKENYVCDVCANITDCSFNISSLDSVDIKCEVCVCGIVCEDVSCSVATQMEIDETKEKQMDDAPSLVVYYAKKGECLWDIALKYNTSVEKISEANHIDDDELMQNRMLLIPGI